MAASPFQSVLHALLRPLEFAARDDFAHVGRVRNLGGAVAETARRAAALAVPPDARQLLERLAERFDGPLEGEAAVREVGAALAAVRPLARTEWAAAALARSPEVLRGVGARRAQALARRELRSVEDLLFHLPVRYDDRRSLVPVGELEVGRRATFLARVLVSDFVSGPPRRGGWGARRFEAVVGDDSGTVSLKWFRGGEAISRQARKDAWLLVSGDVKRYRFSKELHHPEIEGVADPEAARRSALLGVVPDYATPEGLHPRWLRSTVRHAVEEYADLVGGHLPESVARAEGLPPPAMALRVLHEPGPEVDVEALREGRHPARARLVLEELYLLELGLALRRAARGREPGVPIAGNGPRTRGAPDALPFRLTRAQQRAWQEIRADLARPHPMNRLLEGDVGSGKTVVAFLAAVAVAESGRQSALMAPTELLAEQHARTLGRLAELSPGAGLRVALLTSSVAKAEAQARRTALAQGGIDLVVGTHALLHEGVAFRNLAFAVIDEQHRFGVRQRGALAAKAEGAVQPHVLVMTATPIPRTLALTAYGDLDLSVIDELPPGREPACTVLLRPGEAARAGEMLRETVQRGEQVYVVYPLVEESERSDLRAASESAERIARAFPAARVDLVHGRLDAAARAEAMARFEAGETQVLVSTTVIEVGVDVPGATLMIVEHAERFGLAQLHQLRGRVGRGSRRGRCVLVARGVTEHSEARLAALLETSDGFRIAEADLRIRGPGEFLGTRQHGRLPDLRLADLVRDGRWVARAREAALARVRRDPGLRGDPELLDAVRARWGDRLDLAEIG
jgi:ATP-dependent DNA helicase RecG